MAQQINKETLTEAMMAFIKSLDPHASLQHGLCQCEIADVVISANYSNDFESVRRVFEDSVERIEWLGFMLIEHPGE